MASKKFDVVNEQIILSVVINDENDRRRILGIVNESMFLGKRHKVIFSSIKKCVDKNLKINCNNIAMHSMGDYGGLDYLENLKGMDGPDDIIYHVVRLRQDYTRLNLIKSLEDVKEVAGDRTNDFYECVRSVNNLQKIISGVDGVRNNNLNFEKWNSLLSERLDGHISFVSTGYKSLDEYLIEGFFRKGLTVIAGRPRMGKSTFVVDCIGRLLKSDLKIAHGPWEGGPSVFIDSLVSNKCGIDLIKLIKQPDKLDKKLINKAKNFINRLERDKQLTVLSNPFLELGSEWTNDRAMDKTEEILAEGQFDIVFFDLWERCLTKLDPKHIAPALVKMQTLLQKYDTHGVIVQQLQRKAEDRDKNKFRRPTLGDLKNSGAYEEVADLVLLIHREKVYKPFMRSDIVEINIAKQKRNLDNMIMMADFMPEMCRLENDRMGTIDDVSYSKAKFSSDD